jgi:arylsulfatase A-like enzyme
MNVLVLAAHGLNCHWLGPYGNEWVSTPALDALACESIAFDRHFADDPSSSGVDSILPPNVRRTLCAAGVSVALVDDRKGSPPQAEAWDLVVRTDPAAAETPGDALIAAVESALDRLPADRTWLLWIETDRLVPPWDFDFETYQHYARSAGGFTEDRDSDGDQPIPEPVDQPASGPVAADDVLWHQLRNSFAAAVTSFDAEVDVLAEVFRERGLDRSAAWIVTSGYGWPLAEHGLVGPAESRMHAELVHLPLLLRLPGHREKMRRVPAFTQTSDLVPTLAELVESGFPGMSLLPLAMGKTTAGRDAARSTHGPERAIRTPEWAFLPPAGDRPARLYRKPDDIWEVNDLAPRHPDECDRLAALLDGKPTEGP